MGGSVFTRLWGRRALVGPTNVKCPVIFNVMEGTLYAFDLFEIKR